MKGRVKWVGDVMFVAESGSGHGVVVDGAPESGGRNMGMRPMELMLLSVGACSAFDVVTILKKARQQASGCEVALEGKRAEGVPAVYTDIHLHFKVSGRNLNAEQVKRAVELSSEKYCSASMTLREGGVNITHDFEIVEDG